MKKWLLAFSRPSILLGGLTTIGVYMLADALADSILPAITVMAGSASAVLYNDWCDRTSDLKKGKSLAYDNPNGYLAITLSLICVLMFCIILTWVNCGTQVGMTLVVIGLLSFTYSHLKSVPFLPAAMVATIFSLIIWLPAASGYSLSNAPLITLISFILVYAREIMLDLEDIEVDRGSKWTLPLALGKTKACKISAVTLLTGTILLVLFNSLYLVMPFSLAASLMLYFNLSKPIVAKRTFDAGIALALITAIIK
jgi:4-hydroxybenzoate polyprenyltransferase